MGVFGQAPERPVDAREQDKQHEQNRQGLQDQAGRVPEPRRRAEALLQVVKIDQAGGQDEDHEEHVDRGWHGLAVEEIGDHQKIAETDRYIKITPRPALKELQAGQQDQQRDAGVAPGQGAIGGINPRRAARHERQPEQADQPLPGAPETGVAVGQVQPGREQRGMDERQPERQARPVRHTREQDAEREPAEHGLPGRRGIRPLAGHNGPVAPDSGPDAARPRPALC